MVFNWTPFVSEKHPICISPLSSLSHPSRKPDGQLGELNCRETDGTVCLMVKRRVLNKKSQYSNFVSLVPQILWLQATLCHSTTHYHPRSHCLHCKIRITIKFCLPEGWWLGQIESFMNPLQSHCSVENIYQNPPGAGEVSIILGNNPDGEQRIKCR